MRVLMLTWEYPPRVVGGLARHVYHLAGALSGRGVEVHVLTCGQEGSVPRETQARVTIHRVQPYPVTTPGFLPWVLQLNVAMLEQGVSIMEGEGPFDLIHAHDWLVALAARALKHLYRTPLIATIHATEHGRHQGLHNPDQRYISGVEWYLTYEAWKVICCSQYMKSDLMSVFGLPPEKLAVIPNGIDPGQLAADPLAPGRSPNVLFVGRLVPEKGVSVLLDAAPRVLEACPEARFIVVGSGPAASELQHRAAGAGVGDRVTFAGYVDDETLAKLYRLAAVAVFPSLYEPFGIVALEAMASGAALVVSDTGGLAEIVEHEVNGIKTEPGNARALAEHIIRLLTNEPTRQRLVAAAYQKAVRDYSWPGIAAATFGVYTATVAAHRDSSWRRDLSSEMIRRARALGRQMLAGQYGQGETHG
ncbi:MAG: glycosyltransferase family 4 protein [Bacillota bacterium]